MGSDKKKRTNLETDSTTDSKSGTQLVTIEQAMDLCGGYGKFQRISASCLIVFMVLSQCFLYSFPFLESTPKYLCKNLNSNSTAEYQCGP